MLYALGVQAFAGMDVTIREPDVSPLQVQGPKSRDVIRAMFGDEVADLRYYRCWEGDLGSIPVVVSRTGWTGEVGYEIYLRDGSRHRALGPRDGGGSSISDPRDRPERPAAARAGIFNYGNDMTVQDTPFHVTGMERLVEFDADFIGKEALRRVAAEGVDRKLVGVRLGGEPFRMWLEDFWVVRKDGRDVGRLVSASHSFRRKENIGYAWVPIELAEPGTSSRCCRRTARFRRSPALPFLDRTRTSEGLIPHVGRTTWTGRSAR